MKNHPDQNRRILVIDDNRAIHEDFRKILHVSRKGNDALSAAEAALFAEEPAAAASEAPEFEIDSAYQGQEGLALIEQSLAEGRPYAMAFVDVRMPPGWDGVETTAKIWEKYPDLQVVICTAYSDYSWEEMLKKLGYSDRLVILKKPFDNIEVLQLTIALTEKWRLYQQAKLRLDDLEHLVRERTSELRNSNSELATANEMLMIATEKTQKMADAVLAASMAKGEFLANMSHEIRTPMNGVIGMINLLMDTELTPEQQDFAGTIKVSADSLLEIINDILDFSKIEAGKLTIESIDFDLADTVQQAVKLLVPRAQDKGLELNYTVQPGVPTGLTGDPSRIRQVLLNLLSNAVKFTPKGRVQLDVRLREQTARGARIEFSILDTGVGMSEEVQKKLFRSFSQADASTTRKFGGTGLGLAISRRLVELMGGSIAVTSVPGKGSTFTFDLALPAQPTAAPAVKPVTSGVAALPTASPPGGKRVLLVEDNKINQLVGVKLLMRLGCGKVDIANNGREAVEAWQRIPIDLILMDCQMPEMDGYQATQKIRELQKNQNRQHIRIVAMTANAMQGDRELCLAAGMDGYLAKPINLGELKAVIEAPEPAGPQIQPVPCATRAGVV